MSSFLTDLETGIVNAILADADVAALGITVTTSQSDDQKETLSAFVALEFNREIAAGSRIFILDGTMVLRVNRSQYSAEEASNAVQNLVAALLNPIQGSNGFDAFSYGSGKCLGFVAGAQNVDFKDEVELHAFSFKLWGYQVESTN